MARVVLKNWAKLSRCDNFLKTLRQPSVLCECGRSGIFLKASLRYHRIILIYYILYHNLEGLYYQIAIAYGGRAATTGRRSSTVMIVIK